MRMASVDTARFIAIIAIIAIHTTPFYSLSTTDGGIYYYLHLAINMGSRFAVPFFFTISGYFFFQKVLKQKTWRAPLQSAKRVAFLFVFWSSLYAILSISLGPEIPFDQKRLSEVLFFEGSKVHLWFLSSLFLCMLISTPFLMMKKVYTLFFLGLFLFILGVCGKAYSTTIIGLEFNHIDTRNGPFFGMLFFSMGALMNHLKPKENWFRLGFSLFIIGSIMHSLEIYILMKLFNGSVYYDYVFSTILTGLGFTMVSLSEHRFLRIKTLAKFGKVTLGIYACHFIFVDIERQFINIQGNPFYDILLIPAVYLSSLVITLFFSKNRFTKKLVM
jgi:surface polysaccharide O-acyltransferase-like enzyme